MRIKNTAEMMRPVFIGVQRRPCWKAAIWAVLFVSLRATVSLAAPAATSDPNTLWDSQRYIRIEEIEPGMPAYCLTDYGEDGIERFELKVLDIVHEVAPGHDMILVIGLDDRFKHTGPVGGCSGSPVYIRDRLAGALAYGWTYAKDPLYGVTPIEEMLQADTKCRAAPPRDSSGASVFSFDFSQPINPSEVGKQLIARRLVESEGPGGMAALPCPLLLSGLSAHACRELAPRLADMGFVAAPNLSGEPADGDVPAAELKPGAPLAIALITGDVMVNMLGTATEVRGGRVYGFGHPFRGSGPTELPMAGGKIHTVISKVSLSNKLGSATGIVGVIVNDESTAVVGQIGTQPPMVPLTLHVTRYNDAQTRDYSCRIAYDRQLTSGLVGAAITGVALERGALPADHTVQYKAVVHLDDGRAVCFNNTSTGQELAEPTAEIIGALALLLNNPFRMPDIRSLDFDLCILAENISSRICSVDVLDPKVKPGQHLRIEVVIESFLKERRKYQISLVIPESLSPGKYDLMLLGSSEYEKFLRSATPYRFVARDDRSLVKVLNETLNCGRVRLYCLLVLPQGGIVLDGVELPDLPVTKAVILQNAKRRQAVQTYPHWTLQTVETGTVVADKAVLPIVVER